MEELAETKSEFVGGMVFPRPYGDNMHNSIAGSLLGAIFRQIRSKPFHPCNSDTKLKIVYRDHVRFYYPDGMVVCPTGPEKDHFQTQPVVVIEVLSKSTRRLDMGEKKDAYLFIPSLKVLILVEADKVGVTVHRRNAEGGVRAELYDGLEEVILLPEIEAEISLAEIYERVEFGN